jgi:hypothetical protein
VNQPRFVPVTEVVDRGIIKYSLEEYMEVDDLKVLNQLQKHHKGWFLQS